MDKQVFLGEFEMIVLLAVLHLGDGAYGVTILQEIEERAERAVSRGAVYITLDRLEKKGYLTSSLGEATAERGGKAKRFFSVTAEGLSALDDSRRILSKMWRGLEPIFGKGKEKFSL